MEFQQYFNKSRIILRYTADFFEGPFETVRLQYPFVLRVKIIFNLRSGPFDFLIFHVF